MAGCRASQPVSIGSEASNFQKARAVSVVVGRKNFKLEVVQFGIEIRKELRIGKKNIDVMAFPMIDL
jgi:hypothetical protein